MFPWSSRGAARILTATDAGISRLVAKLSCRFLFPFIPSLNGWHFRQGQTAPSRVTKTVSRCDLGIPVKLNACSEGKPNGIPG